MSLAYFYLEEYDKAVETIEKTIELHPDSERLIKNKELYEKKLREKEETT